MGRAEAPASGRRKAVKATKVGLSSSDELMDAEVKR